MPKILVADDDRQVLELTAKALVRRGYEVETFADGASACEAAAEGNYDLVLTDHRMPGKTGLDVLRAAKSKRARTPVFVLSGSWLAEEREEAERLGAYVVLNKPVDLAYLYTLIESALMPEKEAAPQASNAAPAPLDAAEVRPIAPPLVLVLEAEACLRKLVGYCLKRQGYRTSMTEEAEEALELARIEPPEAAIASGCEAGGGALAFVERLRGEAGAEKTWVVFLYPQGAVADAVRALEVGADVALEKPFEPEVLFAHLRSGIRRTSKEALRQQQPPSGGAAVPGNGGSAARNGIQAAGGNGVGKAGRPVACDGR